MKKIVVGILTIVYMVVSSGIAINIHYCMGKKTSVDFFGANNNKCGKCGMTEKKGGCCNNEHKFVKLQDSHKNVYNTIDFATEQKIIVTAYTLYNWQMPNNINVAVVNNNAPPPGYGPGACIMNCVFHI
jgi:hypothetical protein